MPDQIKNPQPIAGGEKSASDGSGREVKPAIRTMKSDVAEFLKATKPSLVEILGRSAKPTGQEGSSPYGPIRLRTLYIAVTALTLALVSAVTALWLSQSYPVPSASKFSPPPPLFPLTLSRTIAVDINNRAQFLRLMDDASREVEGRGTIKQIIIKIRDGPEQRFATMLDFLNLYRMAPPPELLGLFDSLPTVFFYSGQGGSRFGLAIKTKDVDHTMAKMLAWEAALFINLRPLLFGARPETVIAPFEDRTLRNIDWRYLKLSANEDLGIGYAVFPAKNILVIATSKEAVEEVIKKLFE